MRERIAYLFMITILILLIALTFGVLGKGHYQPPENEQDKARHGYVLPPLPQNTM